MSQFVRFVFLLVLLSSGMAFALMLVSNMRSAQQREERIADERSTIDSLYKRLDGKTAHALFIVERQETSLDPQTKEQVVSTTTLLFGLCDERFNPPTYVQRIVVPGRRITIDGSKLTFAPSFANEQNLLAGHTFYMFDTISGQGGDGEPFELNPVGYPPLGLRHASPDFTEYDKQLWRPIWEILLASPERTARLGVTHDKMASISADAKPESLLFKVMAGPSGLIVESLNRSQGISHTIDAILALAKIQDDEERTGIKTAPMTNDK